MSRIRIVPTVSLLAAFFIFGSLSFIAVGRVKQRTEQFTQVTIQKLTWAAQINANQAEAYVHTLLFLTADSPEDRSSLRASIEDFRQRNNTLLSEYSRLLMTDGARRRFQDLTEKRDQYQTIRDQIMALYDQGKKSESVQHARISLWPAYQQYTLAGDALFSSDISAVAASADDVLKLCTITQFIAALISIVGFVGGIAVPFVLMWLSHGLNDDPLHA